MNKHLITYLKGFAMGSADIVPGVSGGTVALISGIYGRLLAAISHFDLELLKLLKNRDIGGAWKRVDAGFLMALGAGILTAVVCMSSLLKFLMADYGPVLWGFFSGLILISAVTLIKEHGRLNAGYLLPFAVGMVLVIALAFITPQSADPNLIFVFLAGALAICAMVLPGISGSFILLMLGYYEPVLNAVTELNLAFLITFAAGCGFGLLGFSKLIVYLMDRHEKLVMALLTGILTGSLVKLWPWQGAENGTFFLPSSYVTETGQPSYLVFSLLAVIVGIAIIAAFQHFFARES